MTNLRISAFRTVGMRIAVAVMAAAVCSASAGKALGAEAGVQKAATDAYIFGYPLVTMELTRRSFVNVETASPSSAPMGQFANMTSYPAVDDHRVTAPNADTLYSTAWLDVSKEPYVLSVPDMNGRYFLLPMLDGWTDVFQVPGKRTTGTGAQKYLISGPGWKGDVPAGLTHYQSPTGMVWILGRIYCTGTPEDYAAVHALQAQLTLVPLSSYGKPYAPPANAVNPAWEKSGGVRQQVAEMSSVEYFTLLAQLMKDNPPSADDAPAVAEMARIGLVPGQDFDASKLDSATLAALNRAPKLAEARIKAFAAKGLKLVNGWTTLTKTGLYGTDYVDRAFITAVGLGANRPQDAQYPLTTHDPQMQKYDGANTYVLHFAKGQTPPVRGFWSITMYDPAFFFVANALNKQTVSPRDDLHYNADGSIDLYFSHAAPPNVPESNWLPAPAGNFQLMLRMYWPDEPVLDGSWKVPEVTKLR